MTDKKDNNNYSGIPMSIHAPAERIMYWGDLKIVQLLGLIHISLFHSLSPCLCLQVATVRGAQCCSREGVKGELTWTERSRTGVTELSKNFHCM